MFDDGSRLYYVFWFILRYIEQTEFILPRSHFGPSSSFVRAPAVHYESAAPAVTYAAPAATTYAAPASMSFAAAPTFAAAPQYAATIYAAQAVHYESAAPAVTYAAPAATT